MKTIFYRCVPHNPDALVFAEAHDAKRVDRIWHALNTGTTWGQFNACCQPPSTSNLRTAMWPTTMRLRDRFHRRR